ncbi:MAG: hypothetical protein NZ919_03765, partial [Candidatus Caldarchaeum sp.]|nr:hypothetical protein [Candidatus Caldarchaeum sp.]
MVDEKFFDTLNYCICSAVNKAVGKQMAREVFRDVGRFHFKALRENGAVKLGKTPLETLENIARYLEKSGYIKRIDIRKTGENEAIVDMYGVSVLDSSVKLTDEDREPSHIMTNTMFAALDEMGYEAELIDLL